MSGTSSTDYTVSLANVEKIQVVEINSTATMSDATESVIVDASANADITDLKVTKATDEIKLVGSDTQNISVAGATGVAVAVDGGNTVTVDSTAAGQAITVGATTGAEGAVTVTSTKQDGDIKIDGGSNVTVTATVTDDDGGDILIGQDGTAIVPTGDVAVTLNLNSDGSVAMAGGDITIDGGKTVNVTVNATSAAADEVSDADITVGTTTVTGDGKTTDVTVTVNDTVTTVTKAATALVPATETLKFAALNKGQTTTVEGLTFTAAENLTAAKVAAAFANLTTNDTQEDGGPTANGTYSGVFAANWTSGAASGDTVVFTSTAAAPGALAKTAGDVDPTSSVAYKAGTAAGTADTSENAVVFGKVVVDDAATAAITTVTLDGFDDADLGETTDLDKLATLSLANGTGTINLSTASTTLALTLNNVDATAFDEKLGSVKTLNITTTGASSDLPLDAVGATTITVAGTADLDLTGSTLTALETLTVTGSASVTLAGHDDTLTSIDASGTTGGVTATIDAATAAFTGGQGTDTVTLGNDNIDEAIDLGKGDDTLTLANGTATADITVAFTGGEGTDTLSLTAADAETGSADAAFDGKFSSFERLIIGNAASQEVIDLDGLDGISHVQLGTSDGTAQVATVTVTAAADDAADAGDIFTATINGTTFSHTATAAQTAAQIATALATLVNADLNLRVTADATAADGTFTLTADDVGVPFTVTVANPTDAGGADANITVSDPMTTANAIGLTLNNLATGGTVVLTGAGEGVLVAVKDAADNTADVLNVVVENIGGVGDTDAGALMADDVETVNITVNDGDNDANIDDHSLVLVGDSVKTITVGSAADTVTTAGGDVLQDLTTFSLVVSGTTGLTTVDASGMLGSFTYTANAGQTTVTGGSGDDTLIASGLKDVLRGGAGDDTLTGADLTTLTGGTGADTFVMATNTSVNQFSNISDIESGDVIATTAGNAFLSAEYELIGANLANYVDTVIANTDADQTSWFNLTVDGTAYTFVVDNQSNGTEFVEGTDMIIAIVGTLNLDTGATYNITDGTLEII